MAATQGEPRLTAAAADRPDNDRAEDAVQQLRRHAVKEQAAQQAAQQPTGQIGQGRGQGKLPLQAVDDQRYDAKGQDDRDGGGKSALVLQFPPVNQKRQQYHAAARAE